ncbi:hypothetical protein H206_05648 [Candidatus Electrothrix aarhusensis]|uniref:Uncharacterized protein n=1 Tax=Candidatus Electrothrix aarhusensis TaxID=1859131 RepID=A0A3S3UDN1_9BACT|nr:hypothetical protein H206_05648 [Candidatus Electrothrix aarhusensis]
MRGLNTQLLQCFGCQAFKWSNGDCLAGEYTGLGLGVHTAPQFDQLATFNQFFQGTGHLSLAAKRIVFGAQQYVAFLQRHRAFNSFNSLHYFFEETF